MQLEARILAPPQLHFNRSLPSRVDTRPYQGLRTHGPFDASRALEAVCEALQCQPGDLLAYAASATPERSTALRTGRPRTTDHRRRRQSMSNESPVPQIPLHSPRLG